MSDAEANNVLEGMKSDALANKAQENDVVLTPEGRYKFQVVDYTVRVGDKEFWDPEETQRNPYYGKQTARVRLQLTSKRETMKRDSAWQTLEKPLTHFISVCPDEVLDARGELTESSNLFGCMAKVAKEAKSNAEVLDYFKDNFGEINIGLSKATEKYKAKNWNRGITAV